MGVIQVIIGALKLGRLIRRVPHPVMMGFVNGLTIVVFLSQLKMFRERDGAVVGDWLHGPALAIMLGLVALTVAIVYLLPRFTKKVPSSLVAIVVVSLVGAFGLTTQTVGDLSSVRWALPVPHLPDVPMTWETQVRLSVVGDSDKKRIYRLEGLLYFGSGGTSRKSSIRRTIRRWWCWISTRHGSAICPVWRRSRRWPAVTRARQDPGGPPPLARLRAHVGAGR